MKLRCIYSFRKGSIPKIVRTHGLHLSLGEDGSRGNRSHETTIPSQIGTEAQDL